MENNTPPSYSLFGAESDEFLRKWSGPVILGPFLPAIFAVINVICASITLNTWQGSCGYAIDQFVAASLAISYIFLIVFVWVFLGFPYTLKIEILHIQAKILYPFTSLVFLIVIYVLLAFVSVIIWIVGTAYTALAIFCVRTAPVLYSYSLFLVVLYWIGFFIVALQMVRLIYGAAIVAKVKDATKAPTQQDMELQLFHKKFKNYDPKCKQLHVDKLGALLTELGMENIAPIPTLTQQLDPTDSGTISYASMHAWFCAQLDNVESNTGVEEKKQN